MTGTPYTPIATIHTGPRERSVPEQPIDEAMAARLAFKVDEVLNPHYHGAINIVAKYPEYVKDSRIRARKWVAYVNYLKNWMRDLSAPDYTEKDMELYEYDSDDSFSSVKDKHGRLRPCFEYFTYPPTFPSPDVKFLQRTRRGADPYLDRAVDLVDDLSAALQASIADLQRRMEDGQRAPDMNLTWGRDPGPTIEPTDRASLQTHRLVRQYKHALASARRYEECLESVQGFTRHDTYVVGVGGGEPQQVAPEHEGLPIYTNPNRLPMVAQPYVGTFTGREWSPSSTSSYGSSARESIQ